MTKDAQLTRNAVERKAQHLLDTYGMKGVPIDVGKLAEKAGYRVVFRYFDEADLSATVIREASGQITLGINTLHAPVRQRFSIAHEIGHAQLHLQTDGEALFVDPPAGVLFRDSRASLGEDPREINANQFAAALLMPTEMVRQALTKLARSGRLTIDSAVSRLASQFEVSPQAMRYRLVVLGFMEPD
jgi:Zn-dependent peptidase ImmA (M78 family)